LETTSDTPEVGIAKLKEGSQVFGLTSIEASVLDTSEIIKVEFYVDGVLSKTLTSAPFIWDWDSASTPAGNHVIKVVAYNLGGGTSEKSITLKTIPLDKEVVYPNPYIKERARRRKDNYRNLPADSTIRIYSLQAMNC